MGTLPADRALERVNLAYLYGIKNAQAIANASQKAGLPFHIALAYAQKESNGQNIYGHDAHGTNNEAGAHPVTDVNFCLFYGNVRETRRSNGVGPFQLTYIGYLTQMLVMDLKPWDPFDNAYYALNFIIKPSLLKYDLATAAGHYNGGTIPNMDYGRDIVVLDKQWKTRFGLK